MHCKHTHTLTDARTHVCLLLHMLVHSFIVTVDISVLGFGFLSAKVVFDTTDWLGAFGHYLGPPPLSSLHASPLQAKQKRKKKT